MSAIAGLWRFDGKADIATDCARILAAQQIYGPHDDRTWSEGALAMGRRLFRTLPEDAYDRQPLHSRDGRLTLVSDVRLDNRDELQTALGLSSAETATASDAAILLLSLEFFGAAALDRIVGDFAFALWDARAQTLTLARDFLGQRPLHYHCGRGFFAFASMPKGLHALGEIPCAADEQAAAEFLALLPQLGPRSFFKGICRVEAGHSVTVSRDGLAVRRYWNPRRPSRQRLRPHDYAEGLRHHFDLAVKARLRGVKGAVGAHLSAGFDSGSVVTAAAGLLAQNGQKVVAFTAVPRAGYDGPDPRNRIGDEGQLAAVTAAMHANIEHILIRSGSVSPLNALDRDFFLYDAPVLNPPNMVWIDAINQAAHERGLRIILTGQFGNMTISYSGMELLPELLRAGRLFSLGRVIAGLRANTNMRLRGAMAQTFGPFLPSRLWRWLNDRFGAGGLDVVAYTAIRADRADALTAAAQERDLDFAFRPRGDSFAMRLWAVRRSDIGNYTKGMLARWGIDQRDPTADRRLLEYCLSVPTDQYLADGVPRALAKRALADRLPAAVLNERRKGFQAADWHEGLTAARDEAAAELERLAECAPAATLLDIDRLKRLTANWPTSGWESGAVQQSYRLALPRGIAVGHFLRRASGANR